jgi:hypothetical protein
MRRKRPRRSSPPSRPGNLEGPIKSRWAQRRRPAVQSHVLAATHAHADLQAFEPIEPTHPLMIHAPAFPLEQATRRDCTWNVTCNHPASSRRRTGLRFFSQGLGQHAPIPNRPPDLYSLTVILKKHDTCASLPDRAPIQDRAGAVAGRRWCSFCGPSASPLAPDIVALLGADDFRYTVRPPA